MADKLQLGGTQQIFMKAQFALSILHYPRNALDAD